MKITAVLIGLLAGISICAAGELRFEQVDLKMSDIFGNVRTPVVFRFKNESQSPVKILDTRGSCDCTTVQMPAQRVEAGKEGEISLQFDPEGRFTTHKKTVIVTTDEAREPVYYLSFSVTVIPLFEVTSRTVSWAPGDGAKQKLQISALRGEELKIRETIVPGGKVAAAVQEIIPGKTYEILLTPSEQLVDSERLIVRLDVTGRGAHEAAVTLRRRKS